MAGIEVNGGDDIEWYVKALTKGWHVGPLANEDEHQREWATSRIHHPHGEDPHAAPPTVGRAGPAVTAPIWLAQ